jgi:hypothetical protein
MTPYIQKRPFSGQNPYSRPDSESFLLMEDGNYLLQENESRIILTDGFRFDRFSPYAKQDIFIKRNVLGRKNPYQSRNEFRKLNPYGQKNITT